MTTRPEHPTRTDDARPDVSEFDGGAPDPSDLDAAAADDVVRPDEYAPTGGRGPDVATRADEADVLEQELEVGFEDDDGPEATEDDRA